MKTAYTHRQVNSRHFARNQVAQVITTIGYFTDRHGNTYGNVNLLVIGKKGQTLGEYSVDCIYGCNDESTAYMYGIEALVKANMIGKWWNDTRVHTFPNRVIKCEFKSEIAMNRAI